MCVCVCASPFHMCRENFEPVRDANCKYTSPFRLAPLRRRGVLFVHNIFESNTTACLIASSEFTRSHPKHRKWYSKKWGPSLGDK